jgi:predicted Fe-Mo cluster-binding NifX family protein
MKIAIPTDDGLILSPELTTTKGFLVIALNLGEIVTEELRWTQFNGDGEDRSDLFARISDCGIVMALKISEEQKLALHAKNMEIFLTRETIITKAVMNFLNTSLQMETNTCCCP